MALPDFAKTLIGNEITVGVSKTYSITLTSVPNGNGTSLGARQSQTIFLGTSWAQRWRLDTEFEFATAPTAGNSVNLFASFYNSNNAGLGNTSGTDAAYTGYNNDITNATTHLEFIGSHICVASATPVVQKCQAGIIFPKGPYMNIVVDNRSGVAFHSSPTNMVIRLTPLDESVVESQA